MQPPGDVLKSFSKWQEAPASESLFNKFAGQKSAASTKRDSNICFPVNSAKFLRIVFSQNTSWRLPFHLGMWQFPTIEYQ